MTVVEGGVFEIGSLFGGGSSWWFHNFLYGGDGGDWLEGGSGQDHLYGESGNDYLYGGHDNDIIYGGDGDDWVKWAV